MIKISPADHFTIIAMNKWEFMIRIKMILAPSRNHDDLGRPCRL